MHSSPLMRCPIFRSSFNGCHPPRLRIRPPRPNRDAAPCLHLSPEIPCTVCERLTYSRKTTLKRGLCPAGADFDGHQRTMAADGITVQPGKIRLETGSQGIQMNVAYQFPQVGVLLAQNRFIAVLKQLAVPFVRPLKLTT